jgi:hypothetical protein
MSDRLFRDRRDTGEVLAGLLDRYLNTPDVIVLGLPRGGWQSLTRSSRHSVRHSTFPWSASLAFPAARKWQWAPLPAAAC